MNYEKVILEMLTRIKDLEEKVDMLQEYQQELQNKDEGEDDVTSGEEKKESGRKRTCREIMAILEEKYGYSVRKGNRSEGSGIVASKNGKSYNIKVSYSRSYTDSDEVICSGWHTVFDKEIDNPDFPYFIFVVEGKEGEFHYFIFKREDLINEFDDKAYDANKKLHFYFRVTKDGKPLEVRETEKDMSAYYNNWDIFK